MFVRMLRQSSNRARLIRHPWQVLSLTHYDCSERITSPFCNGVIGNPGAFDDSSQAFCGGFSTSEYDDLRGSTVSCEIMDGLCTDAIQWGMPNEESTDHLTAIAAIL